MLKYTNYWVLVHIFILVHLILEHSHHPQKEIQYPLAVTPQCPSPKSPQATTNLLSVTTDLPILDISYE